ncbi:MAG: hypothetical protein KAX40_08100 [Herpetosiphon sp.]|nr:hypothetical protein [Herpetosiphon sp.]
MPNFFTRYRTNDVWNWDRRNADSPIRHLASSLFEQRGVLPGDHVYVVTIFRGVLYVLGKMIVGMVGDRDDAAAMLGCAPEELWDTTDHIIAEQATSKQFDLVVPHEITERLRFVSGDSTKGLFFRDNGFLDGQTLRGVRQLTPESATLLDALLPPLQKIEWHDEIHRS